MPSHTIVRAAIHPGIGVARVGDSPDEFFLGPEVPPPSPPPDGGYRDRSGALKRQAARFRIYGYDRHGRVVSELTAANADVKWTVHLANKKASWYAFEIALDIPEATPTPRRNTSFTGEPRKSLEIDPGSRSISGRNEGSVAFDGGRFLDTPVYLGELRTDEEGRLVVLGGRGVSGTPFTGNTLTTFGNNDGWYDDTSDGPVTAEVSIGGRRIPVDAAWVVVAPPNYAPDIISLQPMSEVMLEASVLPWQRAPARPSFSEQILPLLRRFSELQWVNYGFHIVFGKGASYDFFNRGYIEQLASPAKAHAELRNHVFSMFRDPAATLPDAHAWPRYYGDAMPLDSSPRSQLAITQTLYGCLQQWAQGQFIADYDGDTPHPPIAGIEGVALDEQPGMLDKTAMLFCLGGPFHPGCEMTWPMRHPSMYSGPFRLRHRSPLEPTVDYGEMLTPAQAVSETNGPLTRSGPGDVTRWMALPWQADTASCRAGYETAIDAYLPTFWPARVPNHVLTEEDYTKAVDAKAPRTERVAAFNRRATWYRWLNGTYLNQITEMITLFHRFGIVEKRQGVEDDADLPASMFVESTPTFTGTVPHDRNTRTMDSHKVMRYHDLLRKRSRA
jgi:hypothetical protein